MLHSDIVLIIECIFSVLLIGGKIIQIFPETASKPDAAKPWRKVGAILETVETYPKKIYFEVFNERIDQNPMEVGQMIHLTYSMESREYQGKWYTSVRGLSVTVVK